MQIPNSFKDAIEQVFYDKDIVILNPINSRDAHGGTKIELSDGEHFKGNVNFSIAQEIQEEYGLDLKIDIVITTNFKVPENSYIKYRDIVYKITDNKLRDSHCRLLGVKYEY